MSADRPQSWLRVLLNDVGEIVTGKTPSTKNPDNFGGSIPFIKPADLDNGGYVTRTADTLTDAGAKLVPTIPANSIPVTCIGNLGKVGITNQISATNQQINTVVPSSQVDYRFFYYQLQTLKPWMQEHASATTVTIINKGKFSKAPLALAPLAEQNVIADKLDTLLAQVETTKARLERIPQILKRFRQSVLAAAVSGQLTEKWRENKPFNPEIKFLSEVIKNAQVGLVRSSKEQEHSPSEHHHTPYLKMNNISNDWGVSIDDLVYVNNDDSELKKYKLQAGDWLFNTRNSSELVGKSCVWKDSGEYIYNNNILRIRLIDGYSADYLEIWFRSPEGRFSLGKIKSATTSVAAIYQKQLLKQPVPFPHQQEQIEIVRRVDQLFAYADRIEQQVQAAQERVNNLTQSILAKAFRGELTEQWRKDNPELINGENSASALLDRIKAERATKPAKKTRTGKKI